jgi:hypothetical protein
VRFCHSAKHGACHPAGKKQRGKDMSYVNFSDILRRTIYSKRGLLKMAAREDFPAAAFTVGAGKIRIWNLDDIVRFEAAHPELTSEAAKHRKVVGYGIAKRKGRG